MRTFQPIRAATQISTISAGPVNVGVWFDWNASFAEQSQENGAVLHTKEMSSAVQVRTKHLLKSS